MKARDAIKLLLDNGWSWMRTIAIKSPEVPLIASGDLSSIIGAETGCSSAFWNRQLLHEPLGVTVKNLPDSHLVDIQPAR